MQATQPAQRESDAYDAGRDQQYAGSGRTRLDWILVICAIAAARY
jgi:hypothetical protein